MIRRYLKTVYLLLIAAGISFAGCSDNNESNYADASKKAITSFIFEAAKNDLLESDVAGVILSNEIKAAVPIGTDLSSLIATFEMTGVSVSIGENAQESGITINDFSSDKEYTVTAEDGTKSVYTVTIFEGSVITFEELELGTDSYWAGEGGDGYFTSNEAIFENSWTYYPEGAGGVLFYWSGFAYSNMTDMETKGHTNQFSVYGEGGVNGSNSFGICYVMLDYEEETYEPIPQELSFVDNANYIAEGVYVANTTYAVLSMLNGDQFAKPFGGETGDDSDWFILIVEGFDSSGDSTGTVEFYLADYRFANNNFDYIVTDWTWIDLSSLGAVAKLAFSVNSSDESPYGYGINTPAYFALDNLTLRPAE